MSKMYKESVFQMKKSLKKAVCMILCAAMLVSTAAIGASAATKTECNGNCDHSPIVILPGINHSPTYLYDENDEPYLDSDGKQVGGTLLIMEMSKLWGTIPGLVGSLLATLLTQHSIGLEKAAYNTVSSLFWVQECNNDGNYVNNLQTKRWNHPISEMNNDDKQWLYRMIPLQRIEEEVGGDHIYMYTFNLVGDPMQSATELDAYIDMVKQQTGHDKVTLLPVSLGGTILTSYLDAYGHDDIDQIVNIVACLDGTDIVADMMERKWNLTDEYLYHEYIPMVMGESDAALGYLINCILHILPRSGVNAVLTGAISGILDTMMINCPQMWAMVPSYRYDALAAKYLNDPAKAKLKEKTDRFQRARLNLKQNILAAVADGVKVDSIAGANLDFGEQDYAFFNIVASASDYNSDGIINLSSTTMGATGAPGNKTLSDISYTKSSHDDTCNINHISPDGMVDASTAVLPDNTWIFLEQHHEVGNNDVVLNLAQALLTGKVENVHSDPEKYPQFNYRCKTKNIRRWRLPDAITLLESYENGEITMPQEDVAELKAAIAQGQEILAATIADQTKVQAAEDRLNAILAKYGKYSYPEEKSGTEEFFTNLAESASKGLVNWLGGGSLVDWLLSPIRGVFAGIFA